jgi:hypothetical protein
MTSTQSWQDVSGCCRSRIRVRFALTPIPSRRSHRHEIINEVLLDPRLHRCQVEFVIRAYSQLGWYDFAGWFDSFLEAAQAMGINHLGSTKVSNREFVRA